MRAAEKGRGNAAHTETHYHRTVTVAQRRGAPRKVKPRFATSMRAPARKPGGARGGHSGRRRMLQGVGYPTSIVLRCRVTPPFAELRQMLLVNAVDLGLHLGMPALDQDGEFTHQPARAKPVE